MFCYSESKTSNMKWCHPVVSPHWIPVPVLGSALNSAESFYLYDSYLQFIYVAFM